MTDTNEAGEMLGELYKLIDQHITDPHERAAYRRAFDKFLQADKEKAYKQGYMDGAIAEIKADTNAALKKGKD